MAAVVCAAAGGGAGGGLGFAVAGEPIVYPYIENAITWWHSWPMLRNNPNAKCGILEAVHETASDLHRLGFIDKRKQRKLDALCLELIPRYDSERIRALRDHLKLSQTVLASVLNTSPSTVRKWEIG